MQSFLTDLTTLEIVASNSRLQSGHLNHAFLIVPVDTSLGEQAFLLLHMAATFGYLVAKSLMPGTTILPEQIGQPVRPFFTAFTTLRIMVLNSCLQSGHLNNAFILLLTYTSLGEQAFLSLHIAAASGHCEARSLMPGTTVLPAQTGQPVRPFFTEFTTSEILASNS